MTLVDLASKKFSRLQYSRKKLIVTLLIGGLLALLVYAYGSQFQVYGYFGDKELSQELVVLLLIILPSFCVCLLIWYLTNQVSQQVRRECAELADLGEVSLYLFNDGLFFESQSSSMFWTFDSLYGICQSQDGLILQSGALTYFVPNRAFVFATSQGAFMGTLLARARTVDTVETIK